MKLFFGIQTLVRRKLSSFRNKLMLSFLLISVVPIIIVGIVSYNLSFKIARDHVLNSLSYSGDQLNATLTSRFKQMENAANSMQFYMYTLILRPSSSLTELMDKFSDTRNSISNLQDTYDFFNISVYTKPEMLFSNQGLNFFKIEDLEKHGLPTDFSETQPNQLHWNLFLMKNKSMDSEGYISSYKAFKTKDSKNLEYAFFIDIKESEISKMLAESSPHPSIVAMIVDSNGKIISHITNEKLGTFVDEDLLKTIKSNSGQTIPYQDRQLIVDHNNVADWYLVTDVPNEYIKNNINILINMLIAILLAVIFIAIIAGILMSNSLSVKIRRLSNVISSFKAQDTNDKLTRFRVPIDSNKLYFDELDRLATTFNSMLDEMDENFEKILEMSLHEENLKYQLLQSKINPHFLYNILESIKACQSLGRIEDANAMLSRLAKFYRQILKKSNDLITIKDELEIAVLYLEMEMLSHNRSFTWTIEKEEGIDQFLIPRFSLQPLLENCIRHGLANIEGQLTIHMRFYYLDEEIGIQIKDNGVGIPQRRLDEIRNTLRNKIVDTNRFYGISNVNYRLSKYSIKHKGLEIDSEVQLGTTVTATIQQMIPDEEVW